MYYSCTKRIDEISVAVTLVTFLKVCDDYWFIVPILCSTLLITWDIFDMVLRSVSEVDTTAIFKEFVFVGIYWQIFETLLATVGVQSGPTTGAAQEWFLWLYLNYPCIYPRWVVGSILSMVLQALCWTLAASSVSWSFTKSVGLLGRGISPSQGRYLHTGQHKHTINAHRRPSLEGDSNPRTQCVSGRAVARTATVIGG
jgi:hypothetical protein